MLLVSESGLESIAQFLTVLALFIVVLVITYLTTRYVAGAQRIHLKGKNIEVIEAQKIAPNIMVQVLRVGDRYVAVAVGRDSVTLLGDLNKDDITLPEDAELAPAGFKSILDLARSKARKK